MADLGTASLVLRDDQFDLIPFNRECQRSVVAVVSPCRSARAVSIDGIENRRNAVRWITGLGVTELRPVMPGPEPARQGDGGS